MGCRCSMAWAALPLAIMTSGCSFIFVNGPPDPPPPPPGPGQYAMVPECTTSRAWPIVDTIVGGYQVVRTVYAVSAPDSAYSSAPISREVDIAAGVSLTALFVASAITGYGRTSACDDFRARLFVPRPMTPAYPGVPPTPPVAHPAPPPAVTPPPATVMAPAPAEASPPPVTSSSTPAPSDGPVPNSPEEPSSSSAEP
jgi:hypothetical protein